MKINTNKPDKPDLKCMMVLSEDLGHVAAQMTDRMYEDIKSCDGDMLQLMKHADKFNEDCENAFINQALETIKDKIPTEVIVYWVAAQIAGDLFKTYKEAQLRKALENMLNRKQDEDRD